MDTLKFEWDPNKNEINKKKHGLSFETAKEVFYDEFAILFDDPDHSIEEERFLIIGSIKSEKICIVSHCYRDHENRIRIISARQATKTEQRAYLDGIWGDIMRDEYNISELNPRKNPYASRLKKQITINIDGSTIDYFKSLAEAKGIPYQTLINLYLRDCADNRRQLQMSWQ